jgi:hypothetical protein
MERLRRIYRAPAITGALIACHVILGAASASAQALPGGTLDPLSVPKFVTPLVIPPVMDDANTPDDYDLAVREFQQQILPGGIWNTLNGRDDDFPATPIWSYGPAADEPPDSSALGGAPGVAPAPNSQFNYPAYTVETLTDVPVSVRWINDLVDPNGDCLSHLLPIDQTLHWANPPATGCRHGDPNRTDCATDRPEQYTGPVPIVTHVHGAHVDPHSDGYPEAWWLPACNQASGYATSGSIFDDATGTRLPTGPARDHALVPRPLAGHDPLERLRGPGGLLARAGSPRTRSRGLRRRHRRQEGWARHAPWAGSRCRPDGPRAQRPRRSGAERDP